MSRESETVPLPRLWRNIFLLELPLVFGTVGYWMFAPMDYLERALGPDAAANAHAHPLLVAYAGVVFSMVGWLYARLLLAPTVHLRSFRLVQEALLLGDVWIVVSAMVLVPDHPIARGTSLTAAALAFVWGAIRSVYLVRSRPKARACRGVARPDTESRLVETPVPSPRPLATR